MSVVKVIVSVVTKAAALLPGRNNNEDEANKHPLLILIIVIISLLIIIPSAALSTPGILAKSMFNKNKDNIDFTKSIEDSDLYSDSLIVYNEYKSDYNEKVEDIVEKLKRDNPVIKEIEPITVVNGEIVRGEPIEIEVSPNVIVTKDFDEVDIYYLLAFINTQYYDYQQKNDKYIFNKAEIRTFIETITSFTTTHNGNDPIYLYANITVLSLDEIADIYFKDKTTNDGISKKDLFIASYQALKEDNLQ